jgi:hypothetical protein
MLALIRKKPDEQVDKEDVMQIFNVESIKKYDIEKTKGYLGYKLFW